MYKVEGAEFTGHERAVMLRLSIVGIGFVVGFIVVGCLTKSVFETPQTL